MRSRSRRDDRPSRQEFASHAQDGTLRKSIRKEQREAKRRAERERLARLGY